LIRTPVGANCEEARQIAYRQLEEFGELGIGKLAGEGAADDAFIIRETKGPDNAGFQLNSGVLGGVVNEDPSGALGIDVAAETEADASARYVVDANRPGIALPGEADESTAIQCTNVPVMAPALR
jgi:hypothetical protein